MPLLPCVVFMQGVGAQRLRARHTRALQHLLPGAAHASPTLGRLEVDATKLQRALLHV